jgi:hypothetical protein
MMLISQLFSAFATQNTMADKEIQSKTVVIGFRFAEIYHPTNPLFFGSPLSEAQRA